MPGRPWRGFGPRPGPRHGGGRRGRSPAAARARRSRVCAVHVRRSTPAEPQGGGPRGSNLGFELGVESRVLTGPCLVADGSHRGGYRQGGRIKSWDGSLQITAPSLHRCFSARRRRLRLGVGSCAGFDTKFRNAAQEHTAQGGAIADIGEKIRFLRQPGVPGRESLAAETPPAVGEAPARTGSGRSHRRPRLLTSAQRHDSDGSAAGGRAS